MKLPTSALSCAQGEKAARNGIETSHGEARHAFDLDRTDGPAAWRRRERGLHLPMCRRADAGAVSKRDRSAADLSCNELSERAALNSSFEASGSSTPRHLAVQAGAGLRFRRQLPMAAGVSLARRTRAMTGLRTYGGAQCLNQILALRRPAASV